MCGIAGFIDFNKNTGIETLSTMVNTISHRGPDDQGVEIYNTKRAIIGFAQARLSIIDLSRAGHQPMHFEYLSIVFNGEIYNYKEIRKKLEGIGHIFRTNSDTEVILHAIFEWGKEAINKFIGMFVFCIYDRQKMEIEIFRDRAGVKPIFFYYYNGLFLFGSELKALMACLNFKKEINKDVLPQYLQYGYIPSPNSIFKNCFKLNAGSILTIDIENKNLKIKKYWSVSEYYKLPKMQIKYEDAKEKVHELLISACNYRMVADVPVGVFLSGGYDSTGITAVLQSQNTEKLQTFTIGFYEGNNEAPYAKKIAEYLGTDHTELYCTSNMAQDIIPELPYFYDEPFADSSAIPTMLVSRLAARKVKVALSADGGDELFCGYEVYSKFDNFSKKLDLIPSLIKPILGPMGSKVSKYLPHLSLADKYKLHVYFESLSKNKIAQGQNLYKFINEKPINYILKFIKHDNEMNVDSAYIINSEGFENPMDLILATDYQVYLTDDILIKVDRASMSTSIEGREPLLDHRLIEFVAQLPLKFKYNGKIGKFIFKDIINEYVPKEMMDRKKSGFTLPINSWLRTDLVGLLDEYLSFDALKWSGLFNEKFINREIENFKQNKMYYSNLIWYLLMFQMWYKRWIF